jgi:hypothetical protein
LMLLLDVFCIISGFSGVDCTYFNSSYKHHADREDCDQRV